MRTSAKPRSRSARLWVLLGLSVLTVLWACGDQNLFGPGSSAPPQVVSIQLPQQAYSGQELDVRARVVGSVPIDSVLIRVRGAFADQKVVFAPDGKEDFTLDTSFQIPDAITDTTATVEVVATDVRGNSSAIATGTARITDTSPPTVSLSLGSQQVALGKSFSVDVTASDNVGLQEVGVRAFFSGGDTLVTESVASSARNETHTFDVSVPLGTPEGELTVEAFAVDQDGNEAVSPAGSPVQVVFVDTENPSVTVTLPNVTGGAVGIGVPLLVQAAFTDNGGVAKLTYQGLGLRGDPSLGTDSVVARFQETTVTLDPAVADSTVERVLASVPADSSEEDVKIIVTATDEQGNVGADTVTVTVKPDLLPPTVTIDQPAAGAGVAITDSMLVDVTVADPTETLTTGVKSVLIEGVSFEGDRNLGTFQVVDRYKSKEVDFDPTVSASTPVMRYLEPLGDTTATKAWVRVTATDGWGNQTKDSVQIQLGAPSVRFISPADSETVAPGSPITIDALATDATGVASLKVTGSGGLTVAGLPLAQSYSPAQDTARLTQTITVPNTTGTFQLTATAVNANGIQGSVGPITINVAAASTTDTQPPELKVSYRPGGSPTDGRRVEGTDSVTFVVEGHDNTGGSGVSKIGVTVLADARNRTTSPNVRSVPIVTRTVSPARGGTFTTDITVPVSTFEAPTMGTAGNATLDLSQEPDTVNLKIYAFMVDASGNCGASISPDTYQSLTCQLSSGDTIAAGASGQDAYMVGVRGQTVLLPAGGSVADAVLDTMNNQLVLSNIGLGRLDVFDLATRTFGTSILVGAEPWGMTFSRTAAAAGKDSLYVANSAGTNISVVSMSPGAGQEDLTRRILTPNTALWEVTTSLDAKNAISIAPPVFYDFSDRPQFIAQDANGSLVYSTKPTSSAPDGTIRLGIKGVSPGDTTEVILYTEQASFKSATNTYPIGNVDSLQVLATGVGTDDSLRIFDHDVDSPGSVQMSAWHPSPADALNDLETNPNVYANPQPAIAGKWDIASIGLSDTTFVAASGDGSLVAIGEGATAPTGRIMLYQTPTPVGGNPKSYIGSLSHVVNVADLVGNESERVLGVALNQDGTMGAARGLYAVYFFTPDLRLQGSAPVSPGGAGIALHPLHSNGPLNTNANVSLAFAGTGQQTIEIFDTRHFTRIGRAFIRQNIVGPIRALMPTAADNAGLTCPTVAVPGGNAIQVFSDAAGLVINPGTDDACTVVKLTGVTDDGGVVVVNVTKADVVRDHP